MNSWSSFRIDFRAAERVFRDLEGGVPSLVYGRFEENALCLVSAIMQIMASCFIVATVAREDLTILDIWWFIINCVRVIMVMIFRLQKMVKLSNDAFDLQFRRLLILYNLLGFAMVGLWIVYVLFIQHEFVLFASTTGGFLAAQFLSSVALLGRAYGCYRHNVLNNARNENSRGAMGQALLDDAVDNEANLQMDDLEFARRLQQEENSRALDNSQNLREEQDQMFAEMERECFLTAPLDVLDNEPDEAASQAEPEIPASPKCAFTDAEPEPSPDCIQLRMRLPCGKTIKRRFLVTDPVEKAYLFLESLKMVLPSGERVRSYVLATQFPREEFGDLNIPFMATSLVEGKKDDTGTVASPILFVTEI